MKQNILIINGHQVQTTSPGKLNATLVDHAKQTLEQAGLNVKTSHVDTNYDVEKEVIAEETLSNPIEEYI